MTSVTNPEFSHSFPAVRGVQAGRACYIAMLPMRLIPKIFCFDEESVPPELRAQRKLNKSRIPDLSAYLLDNPKNYTLSAITASVNAKIGFAPLADSGPGQNMGTIQIPMDAQILINDGQHRRAGIEAALAENSELGHDHISVLFFIDEGLKTSQQMFADLNKHAVRPSNSISTLYDHRDQLAELARYLVRTVSIFDRMTELEKSSISNRSPKLFTISSIKNSSKALLRKGSKHSVSDEEMELAAEFWEEVGANMPDWNSVKLRKVTASEMREQFVHAHGVALQAIGMVGADLVIHHTATWKKKLKKLSSIDWSRASPDWNGRAVVHGRISKSRTNVILTCNYIKKALSVELTKTEMDAERAFNDG
ncbi:DNA sulfur modification protein DndB [Seongchinamella sediminis]|uniref:DNA sulfur modification protein DndB n=1 Tax=Seongchinamella sediminis TaxID=2283635 RepID=A0A3L7DS54_9GAMM|nr:DNA sulfur modification protein DndB [Seongchinamella sediminis]RLQ20254.1 DNA sulfur modification protein DndB [Seongchinamella sediminis]